MKAVVKIKSPKRIEKSKFDHSKDRVFKALAKIVEVKGFKVRREELKAGPGWRASSGACRARTDKLIFIERRLPQDEQLNFLIGAVLDLNLSFVPEELAELPETTQSMLVNQPKNIAA